MENQLQGIGASQGVRVGQAFVYSPFRMDKQEERKSEETTLELNRLRTAKESCIEELRGLIERAEQLLGEEKAVILKGQISFLNDPSFYPPMEKLIEEESWTAESAIMRITKRTADLFESMANEYMRERAADVRDVGTRLLSQLLEHRGHQLSDIQEEVIIVADDLSPSDTVQLDKKFVLAFATRVGGKTSHTAILANSLGIPAVLGLGEQIDAIQHGSELVLDGSTGIVILQPGETTKAHYLAKLQQEEAEARELAAYINQPAVTKDGFHVELAANIGTPEEAAGLVALGADAVGLYRTEFLFMSRTSMPDEEFQYRAYRDALDAMQGRKVIIRTLDIGGDKELPYLELPHELNPFLGYRAIRLCLDQREVFITQLRAILRASAYGKIGIMFPMISGMQEWRQAKALFEEAKSQLAKEGIPVSEDIELGIMIEIPAAAMIADRFAKEVDFFSIGTNDLVQYTVAVDRMNEKVSYLYDYLHPAVIRLIKNVIDAANQHGKWTGMCGSMAGDPLAAPLLVGLGLQEWSMSPPAMQKVKQVITKLDQQACAELTERLLDLDTADEVREALLAYSP